MPDRSVAFWLFACCLMVALMVAIGGVTRLTESGLSITRWKPISGILPPLNDTQWQEELEHYRTSPQYQQVNTGMTVEQFKGIFWLEYLHRLAGRMTGFVFFLPLLYFMVKKRIDAPLALRLGGILLLGGAQGVIGWYMVKSGLRDIPRVSPYWLAFHLITAFTIFALLLRLALEQWGIMRQSVPHHIQLLSRITLATIIIQIIWGAFVAGLDAGLVYNTFPLMEGQFIPDGLLFADPWYINFFEQHKTVQFTHRMLAFIVTGLIISLWWSIRRAGLQGMVRTTSHMLLVVIPIQFTLGVLTLLHAVPVALASLHQMGALVLFGLGVYLCWVEEVKKL